MGRLYKDEKKKIISIIFRINKFSILEMALNVAYELEWTYVRGCVSLGNNIDFGSKDCKKYPGESTETTVCFCNDEDFCNGSQNLINSNVIITLVVASIL